MTTLKNEILKLLDRVYNLKSEDNEIIADISKNIENTENDIRSNDEYRSNKEKEKNDLESKLKTFEDQKELFLSTFSDVDNSVFASLKEIDINFDVEDMVSKVNKNAPKYTEELNTEITNTIEEINRKIQSNKDLNTKLEGLNKDKEKAENDRNRLTSLFEQGLSTEEIERDSLSKKYVQDILSSPGVFTNNEIQEITKLLMFPEDGLYEYDKNYEDRKSNGFPTNDSKMGNDEVEQIISLIEEKEKEPVKEIYSEPKEEETVEPVEVEETTEEEQQPEEQTVEKEQTVEEEQPKVEQEEVEEPQQEEATPVEEETTVEETEEEPKEEKVELEYDREQIKDIEKQATQVLDLSSLNKPEDEVVELSSEDTEQEETPVEEEIQVQENPFEQQPEVEQEEVEEPATEETEEVTEKQPVEETSDDESIQEYLEEMNLDLNKFRTYNNASIDEVMAFLNGADRNLIKENYEVLRSINVEENTIYHLYDNHMYLTDPELNLKLTLLRSKTISDKKLKELIEDDESGLRENYETIQNRVKLMEKYKSEINEENISLLNKDFVKYDENINDLNDNGFDFDEKETRNYEGLLFESDYIKEDSEVLKNYLIRTIRKNGKYALELFWKDSKDLMFGIDDLIENDLSELINNNPEALGLNTDEIISRVKTCEKNSFPVNEGNDGTVFSKYILDFQEFAKKLKDGNINTDLDHLPSRKEVNMKLPTIIGSQASNLVDILDNYYESTNLYKDIELSGNAKELYEKITNNIETKLNATVNNKYTYNVGDSWISKIKFERNLSVLVDKLNQDNNLNENMEKELILTSILYNLRQDEGTLKKIASSYVESAE